MRTVVAMLVVGTVLAAPVASAQNAAVQAGQKVYEAQKCAMCHAIEGKGNKKFPLDGVGAKLSDAQLKEWVVDPDAAAAKAKSTATPKMPKKFATLPAADVDALVAYMKSLKK